MRSNRVVVDVRLSIYGRSTLSALNKQMEESLTDHEAESRCASQNEFEVLPTPDSQIFY
jgi:hypothetical protein